MPSKHNDYYFEPYLLKENCRAYAYKQSVCLIAANVYLEELLSLLFHINAFKITIPQKHHFDNAFFLEAQRRTSVLERLEMHFAGC